MLKFLLCLLGVVSGLKVVAIGDLHGDYDTALKTYRMAEIVDEEGHWMGGSELTVVQTGDVLDRGDDTIKLFRWIMQLQNEAAQAGGTMVQLLGNHEVMNLKEDYRYVTDQEIASFGGEEARAEAFSKDGWLGQYLRSRNITHQIGNTVFVHGGITSNWAELGVDAINRESSGYLMDDSTKKLKRRKIFSSHEDSPLWFRGFSRDADCEQLSWALEALGANRMVMGHTITSDRKIHTICDGQGLLIDVGLSSVFGGSRSAAVELTQTTTHAIYPEKKFSLPHVSGLDSQSKHTRKLVQESTPIPIPVPTPEPSKEPIPMPTQEPTQASIPVSTQDSTQEFAPASNQDFIEIQA
ncbi:hypothetical protein DSO57_1023708 [Entomophthora muscae]|uniref:Uncharacterized protein n=1 Tax=Entomophthora muscae TaxID=34485 RepID=A0ACC2TDT3_9FUNG|nr:hypothetical protein DSO57_1023708 [Entomophthora muscae]